MMNVVEMFLSQSAAVVLDWPMRDGGGGCFRLVWHSFPRSRVSASRKIGLSFSAEEEEEEKHICEMCPASIQSVRPAVASVENVNKGGHF